MATLTRTTTTWAVRCDGEGCGRATEYGYDEIETRAVARQNGWHSRIFWNGLEHIHRDYCPDCIARRAQEAEAAYERN